MEKFDFTMTNFTKNVWRGTGGARWHSSHAFIVKHMDLTLAQYGSSHNGGRNTYFCNCTKAYGPQFVYSVWTLSHVYGFNVLCCILVNQD